MLLDIPLEVTVELGRTKRSIGDILEFTQGSIIELDKLAGEPVDILVNQKLIAKADSIIPMIVLVNVVPISKWKMLLLHYRISRSITMTINS